MRSSSFSAITGASYFPSRCAITDSSTIWSSCGICTPRGRMVNRSGSPIVAGWIVDSTSRAAAHGWVVRNLITTITPSYGVSHCFARTTFPPRGRTTRCRVWHSAIYVQNELRSLRVPRPYEDIVSMNGNVNTAYRTVNAINSGIGI